MNIIGIDTSSEVATVALMNESKLIAEYTLNHKKSHSTNLMPMLDEMLKACEMKTSDIDLIAVCNGPGSFTGIRIGVATAKALSHVLNVPIVAVNSLEVLAFNSVSSYSYVMPIMDAQRGQVYSALYRCDGQVVELEGMGVKTMEEVLSQIECLGERVMVLGEASELYRDELSKLSNAVIPPCSQRLARASSVCELAAKKYSCGELSNGFELRPVYIRKSQAEVQYEEKMKKAGSNE